MIEWLESWWRWMTCCRWRRDWWASLGWKQCKACGAVYEMD